MLMFRLDCIGGLSVVMLENALLLHHGCSDVLSVLTAVGYLHAVHTSASHVLLPFIFFFLNEIGCKAP
jgi:hypothetical protein